MTKEVQMFAWKSEKIVGFELGDVLLSSVDDYRDVFESTTLMGGIGKTDFQVI